MYQSIGSNDASFNTGNGFNDAIIIARHILSGTITPDKFATHLKIGSISGATFGSTGNKSITGVGFTPQAVVFLLMPTTIASNAIQSIGFMTSSAQAASGTAASNAAAPFRWSSTARCIGWGSPGASAVAMDASYVSMDSDGFTINVNTAANNFDVAYLAIG